MTLQEWQQQGKYYSYGKHRVFYVRAGQGPVLLLLHGFPTASYDYAAIWDALATKYTLLTFDFLGFGLSDKPKSNTYSILNQTELCAQLLQHLGIQEMDVLAHDYGVSVAQELLARDHENSLGIGLRRILFLNGGLFPETHKPRLIQRLLASPMGALVSRLLTKQRFSTSLSAVFGAHTQPTASFLDDAWALIATQNGHRLAHKLIHYMADRRVHRARWVQAMQHSKVPLALLIGDADPVSGAHLAARYEELIPKPRVTRLAGIGHYPQVEAPAAVIAALL